MARLPQVAGLLIFSDCPCHNRQCPVGQFRTEAPLIRSSPLGGWQNEFMRQRSSASTPILQGKQAVRDAPQTNTYQSPPSYSQPMYQSYTSGFQQPQQYEQQPMVSMEHNLSDTDFDAAFSEALTHAQEMDQERIQQIESQLQPNDMNMDQLDQPETLRIGSDALNYVEQKDRTSEQNTKDADELARTAGQLLSSVSQDTSEKFQNSQFLQLMRKIRDREVEVHENDLKETSSSYPTSDLAQAQNTPRAEDPQQAPAATNHFEFPNMDAIYAPTNSDAAWSDADDGSFDGPLIYKRADGSSAKLYPQEPAQSASPFTTYGFDDDQYPHSQIEALHPGGKLYPDQSPRVARAEMDNANATMSGAVLPGTSGKEPAYLTENGRRFEYIDESAGTAKRFF